MGVSRGMADTLDSKLSPITSMFTAFSRCPFLNSQSWRTSMIFLVFSLSSAVLNWAGGIWIYPVCEKALTANRQNTKRVIPFFMASSLNGGYYFQLYGDGGGQASDFCRGAAGWVFGKIFGP